jgi:hypothetical protein
MKKLFPAAMYAMVLSLLKPAPVAPPGAVTVATGDPDDMSRTWNELPATSYTTA